MGSVLLKNKTLLVLGAGASKEFGLPVGVELANRISKKLHFKFEFGRLEAGDGAFFYKLQQGFRDRTELNEHLKVARQISDGIYLTSSIDNYIDTHRNDPRIARIGKATIFHEILAAERDSTLYFDRDRSGKSLDFRALTVPASGEGNSQEEPWLTRLVRILIEKISYDQIDALFSDLTIVSFNYDRCVPQLLKNAIYQVYHLDQSRAKSIVDKLEIVYPYGTITKDPKVPPLDTVEFGSSVDALDIVTLGENIKTYTEQVADDDVLKRIRSYVSGAKTIVFLGFAFHPQNLQMLNLEYADPAVRVFGTAKGFSGADLDDVQQQIKAVLKKQSDIWIRSDLSCTGLLAEFRRTLSRMT